MSTMIIDPRSALLHGISVWRESIDHPFDTDDEATMEAQAANLAIAGADSGFRRTVGFLVDFDLWTGAN